MSSLTFHICEIEKQEDLKIREISIASSPRGFSKEAREKNRSEIFSLLPPSPIFVSPFSEGDQTLQECVSAQNVTDLSLKYSEILPHTQSWPHLMSFWMPPIVLNTFIEKNRKISQRIHTGILGTRREKGAGRQRYPSPPPSPPILSHISSISLQPQS